MLIMNSIKKNVLLRTLWAKYPRSLRPNYIYYKKFRKLIHETEYNKIEQLRLFQFLTLKNLVNYAWHNIQGYKHLWQRYHFCPEKLKNIEDINLIPFTTKEMIRNNLKKFTNTSIKRLNYITTGGSTGIPFGFYQEYKNNYIEDSFIHDMWARIVNNISYSTKSTVLRGTHIKGLYEYGPANSLTLSSFDVDIDNVKEYLKLIEYYQTPIIQAYPSSIYLMAKIMDSENLTLKHKFLAIILASEPLYDFQRELLQKIFKTSIIHSYGATEKVVLAGNCEKDDRFHVYPQYGITEIINCNDSPVKEGEIGEIVGTGFWNYATPLIRYRTKDFAELGATKCDKCNRNYQLLNRIEGRLQDYIIDQEGNLVTIRGLVFRQHLDAFSNIKQMQLKQEKVGEVIVKVIPTKAFNNEDKIEIIQKMVTAINGKIHVQVLEVDNIDRTKTGKFRFLDQRLNLKMERNNEKK